MARELKTILDEANPNKIPAALQVLRAGRSLALLPRTISGVVGVVTTHVLTLPDDAKAVTLLKGYARVGTITGFVEPVADDATLAAGQMQVTAGGDVLFLAADVVTEAEVTYLTEEGEIVTETLPVSATDLATLTSGRRAIILLSTVANVGSSTGAKTTAARGATPGAGFAAITDTGETIEFAAADSVTNATVTYLVFPGTGTIPSFNAAIEGSEEGF